MSELLQPSLTSIALSLSVLGFFCFCFCLFFCFGFGLFLVLPSLGSTMMMPYMPRALCCCFGLAPQRYMNTPGYFATKLNFFVSPGFTGAISFCSSSSVACLSFACVFFFFLSLLCVF